MITIFRILSHLFIKDSENTASPAVRAAYGKMAGYVGIACDLLLCAGKFFAGLISGSVSITADAVNNHTIERDFLREELNMLVHPDPIVGGDSETGQIIAELSRIVCEIDKRISVHDIRIIPYSNERRVVFDCLIPNDCRIEEDALGEEISCFLR